MSQERLAGDLSLYGKNPAPCGTGFFDHSTSSLNNLGNRLGDKLFSLTEDSCSGVIRSAIRHLDRLVVGVVFGGGNDDFVTGVDRSAGFEAVNALKFGHRREKIAG